DVPKTLKISAISEDGLIEGIENNQILAVQWHPERMDEQHQKQFIQYILDFIQNHS
ncbi:MAG: gamma-glutamyl-gamma-aminobutyrate hydrolase family protein, partial [Coprobacillus cateniformis]